MPRVRIGIVANEPSGDLLGAGLIRALRAKLGDRLEIEGVAGPLMQREGCRTLVDMEQLSVMGLVEVLRHLPRLLGIRRMLVRHFLENPPDLFLGIDAPDFNLGLEKRLKQGGITTAHYVCPSVWAWREGRVNTIRKAVQRLLCLLPFEPDYLARHRIDGVFVGHPLADEIPMDSDKTQIRNQLNLNPGRKTLALLPGSRHAEVKLLLEDFLKAAGRCASHRGGLQVVIPVVNTGIRRRVEQTLERLNPDYPITLLDGNARAALQAADVALVASGTATLEALLCHCPMVVAYRVHPLTWFLLNTLKLVRLEQVSLANIVSPKPLARELLQKQASAQRLADALDELLDDDRGLEDIRAAYRQLHRQMRRNASERAAEALLELAGVKF